MQFVKNVSYTSLVSSLFVFFLLFLWDFIPNIILVSLNYLLKVFGFDPWILRDSCTFLLLKTLSWLPQSVAFYGWFPFHAFVTMICWASTEVLLNLIPRLIELCFHLTLSKLKFFEPSVLTPSVFYLIHSVSAEGYLNCISRIQFRCSFF